MKTRIVLTSALLAVLAGGCQTGPKTEPVTNISTLVPTVTALAETKESQEKGGIEIAVVPAIYKPVQKQRVTLEPTQPPALSIMLSTSTQHDQIYVRETTMPYLVTEPGRLRFSVRINNKLARVFRCQGAVVQFNVAGKLVPFGDTDYKEFIDGIVPPRNEAEFNIYGPRLNVIPDSGTIGIYLYDVVTATDAAGNVTGKQNFEWYFSYTNRTEQATVPFKVVQGYMDPAAFQARKMQEQNEQGNHL